MNPHLGENDLDKIVTAVMKISEYRAEPTPPNDGMLRDALAVLDVSETPRYSLARALLEGLPHFDPIGRHSEILYSSLLVSMVGTFESAVSEVALYCFTKHPSALNLEQRSFTWSEITQHASIEDFQRATAAKRIAEMQYGSIIDIFESLKRCFKIDVPSEYLGFDFQEVIQRRHLVVHNSSMVSALYRDRLRGMESLPKENEQLRIDSDYLLRAADLLSVVVFHLCWATASKMLSGKDMEKFENMAVNVPYQMLQAGRFDAAQRQTRVCEHSKTRAESARLVMQVNQWLAMKLDGRLSECRQEIADWDTGVLENRFKLARHALLGENSQALEYVRQMRRDEALSMNWWLTWPLLADVREYAMMQDDFVDLTLNSTDSTIGQSVVEVPE
ncbi:hypothetical protein ACTHAM_001127 [Cellulomonas soli]|uniref:hypothetical protein n=1 Tax=Cellulomonas soli TaxID=931535 RepID=UPI003F856ABB